MPALPRALGPAANVQETRPCAAPPPCLTRRRPAAQHTWCMQSAARRLDALLPRILFAGADHRPLPAVNWSTRSGGLIREGLDAHGLYMIARRVQIVDRAGKQLAQRYVGEFVGEVSLLRSTPAASCRAVDW